MMRPADILAVILVTAIWGFNFVVVEYVTDGNIVPSLPQNLESFAESIPISE